MRSRLHVVTIRPDGTLGPWKRNTTRAKCPDGVTDMDYVLRPQNGCTE